MISLSPRRKTASGSPAFTLIELLAVITIIIILTALVLGTFKYVQDKGARARAEAEIKGMEAGLESYKADNGDYPRNGTTDSLDAQATTSKDPSATAYKTNSLILYRTLSGDTNLDRAVTTEDGKIDVFGVTISPQPVPLVAPKSYFEFKATQLNPFGGTGTVTSLADPWGFAYGFSTANAADPNKGYNPTFDLWSTGGSTTDTAKWVKNW